MWIKVYCSENISEGDVLSYNESTSLWEKTSSMTTPIGVAKEDAVLRTDPNNVQKWSCKMYTSGECYAKCSRDIPDQGGEVSVEQGGVYVDNSTDSCGIILPNYIDEPQRLQNSLVMIHLR